MQLISNIGRIYEDLMGRKVTLIAVSYLARLPLYVGMVESDGEIELYHEWELKEIK